MGTDLRDHLQSSLGGSYMLERELGSGGMSRVFVANDASLERQVVIKVLHPDLAEGLNLERFRREIKVAAQLQHPHIVPLLASGALAERLLYYTMPFVHGESLRDRLTREGGLPIPLVVSIVRDVASALGHAHRQHVVHRDIKPENILLSDGGALVADFGIAKALSAARAGEQMAAGARPSTITRRGTSLGTPAYMAPEQATGDEVDHRADLYALGVVAYELIAGRPPFDGRTAQQLIAAHAATPPDDVARRRPSVPPELAALVMQLLQKQPADRPQSAEEVLQALDVGTPRRRRATAPALVWTLAAAATVIAAVLAAFLFRGSAPRVQPLVAALTAPPGQELLGANNAAFSPDGKQIAFVASDAQGRSAIWLRTLDSAQAFRVDRTDGATWPFWSPDGKSLGFFADRQLRVIDVRGGAPRALCPSTYPSGGAWTRDGVIVYAPVLFGGLYRVSAEGGPCTRLTTLRPGEFDHRRPAALPDGRILFSSFRANAVLVVEPSTGKIAQLRHPGREAEFAAPNWIVFRDEAEGPLYAQPFDLRTLRVLGQPTIVAAHVATRPDAWGRFATSPLAILHNESVPLGTARLVIVDRRSAIVDSIPVPGDAFSFDLSHDEQKIAFGGSGIWIYDRVRRVTTRLPSQTLPGQGNIDPVWSPGDSVLVYRTAYAGNIMLRRYHIASDSSDSLYGAGRHAPMHLAWSPDGGTVGFTLRLDEIGRYEEAWTYSLGTHRAAKIFDANGNSQWVTFSPDGRWLAYQSDESGAPEIYIRSATIHSPAIRVSTAGGEAPRWGRQGRSLYYRAPNGSIMEVAISIGQSVELGRPVVAVVGAPFTNANRSFAVLDNGQHFLAFARGDAPVFTLTVGWQERIR
jgi:eukaryotic-like serine/threonine-protein kinase